MSGRLGCAGRYSAVLHWRGGGQVYTTAGLENLASLQWGRTLNAVSEAQITVTKRAMTPECCDAVGATEPWIHELTIYRDDALVWQGPVRRTVEDRDTFTVEGVDVLGWLEKLVNTWFVRYVAASGSDGPGPPPANGRYRRPVTEIAQNIIRLNLLESSLSDPPDWPHIYDYIVRRDATGPIRFEKDGSGNATVWTEYVLFILDELTKRGLQYSTVGRSILLLDPTTSDTRPVARLSLDDVAGNVEVIRDGVSTATLAFATNQQTNDLTGGRTVVVGDTGTEYGRLDTLVRVQTDQDAAPADVDEELTQAAQDALAGRRPTPIAISIPDGAQLSPTAPVQISELVCGWRIDMETRDFCTQIGQPFLLTDVAVQWGQGQEKVGISLTPLADPYGEPLPPAPG